MTKFQRLHESAVFKTLGATTRTLATMLAIEYGALGALAGVIGAAGSLGLGWVVLPLRARHPVVADAGHRRCQASLLTAVVVGALGVGASLDVLRRKPLGDPAGGMSRR